MNNIVKISFVSSLVLMAAACGAPKASVSAQSSKDTDALVAKGDQMKSIQTERAALLGIPSVEEATGNVAFNEDAITPVFSPHTGRIVDLLAKPGDMVRQGEPLLIIDSPEVVDAENELLAGGATLAKAKAVLKQAERTRDRIEKLVKGEAAAPKDLEQAMTDVESAKSDVQAAEIQIDSSRQRLLAFGKTDAEIDQLTVLRRPDRTTRVLAPISGLVVARKVGPGQYVRPDNPDPLFTIADTSSLWLLAQIYETQIPLVRVGERVELRVLALPGQTFPAQVSYIASSVDPATRRVAVRCVIRNTNGQLKPEMFAMFRFQKAPRQALLVPQQALVREGNINVVWVVEPENHIARRIVEAGAELDGKIEIRSGLNAGEQVVSNGALFLSSFTRN